MAKRESISRLHSSGAKSANFATSQADERTKCSNFEQAPTAAPPVRKPRGKRGQFALSEPAPVTSYQVSQAEIMATVAASMPMDRAADFAVLALRDRLAKRFGRRGPERWRQGERGWPTISM
jgi:hypothetical protein